MTSTNTVEEVSWGTPLDDYHNDANALDEDAFKERHGNGFFLHHGGVQRARASGTTVSTVALEGRPSEPGERLKFSVFPVRKTERSHYSLFIAVGRERTQDIEIPDASISRFHAFITVDDDGTFRIQDGGSKNGTKVNGQAVPKREAGDPVPLSTGARVSFGDIEMSFVRAAEVITLAKSLGAA